jgi:hypothetical protein
MVLKRVWPAAAGAIIFGALASSGPAAAQQYRPGEFLTLDLSKAVLSPKPLGPATSFTPGPLDVTIDRGNNATQTNAELVVDPKDVATATVHAEKEPVARAAVRAMPRIAASGLRAAHARAERPAVHQPRALVALHGRNPVEAQARETRIQTWPCKSGGICDWKR